jgi:hypothetical protein|tara:strand:+ start:229 stop:483 length:255 start_codon:yes stop_codon:yes gene_type:complete
MSQYHDEVEKRRLYLASEEWGNKIAQHYMCKGGVGDLGFGMGYFVYYNNGSVHRLDAKEKITIVQKSNSIEEVIGDYGRAHAGK